MLYLAIILLLGYEIHKLFEFRIFSRIDYIIINYSKQLKNRETTNKIYISALKLSLMNLIYIVVLVFGIIITYQYWFFIFILMLSLISNFIFQKINRKVSFMLYLINSFLSIIILTLILINYFFFKMETFEFFNYLISLI